ncbi:putative XPG/RAD2-type nuclease [Lymphocystis disease virus 4]|uniref:Putative XPG/RAD2-type nuclease n=1 Tax=Lymphocystis disease virus 4 TaxID=2704413 RepID=A0A6B9XI63_9VIRU|nr:putative XPG/RAD2-type nuclease [Lymphocystis disease virus 4]QHR78470.1 putative XPG/RAD2-type nuclease [Lymphocystis disease virus 4]
MGIKGLKTFLFSKGVTEEIKPLSVLKDKKLALDAAFLMHRSKNSGQDWLDILAACLNYLKRNDIQAVFIFDGVSPPEKMVEKLKRRSNRQKAIDRLNVLKSELIDFKESSVEGPVLKKVKSRFADDLQAVEKYACKTLNVEVTPEDVESFQTLIDAVGFAHLVAPGEAELYAVKLTASKITDAVVSFDSDIIAAAACQGVSKIYTDVNSYGVVEINVDLVLDVLGFEASQFLDFCILCGTDFNAGVSKIGPVKAYKALTEYKKLEKVPYDISHINLDRIRSIFKEQQSSLQIPIFGHFDREKVYSLSNISLTSFLKCVETFEDRTQEIASSLKKFTLSNMSFNSEQVTDNALIVKN